VNFILNHPYSDGNTSIRPEEAEQLIPRISTMGGRKTEFVFYNQKTGEPFVDLDAGLQLACRRAEMAGLTSHTLLHTFASRLLERGADITTVKDS
jgi:site-specific recombinase XerD